MPLAYLPVTLGHAADGRPIRMHLLVERCARPRRRRLWRAALIALGLLLGTVLSRGALHPITNLSLNEMSR